MIDRPTIITASHTNHRNFIELESSIDKSIASNIISDLFERANTDVTGKKYINIDAPVLINNEIGAYAQVTRLTNNTIKSIEVNATYAYKGYDYILILAHEIGHLIEIHNGTISKDINKREKSADIFACQHWVYPKASGYAKEILRQHENQKH